MLKCRINWCFVWHASPSEQNKMSQALRSFSKLFSINICDNITCHLIQLKYLSFLNSRQILDIGSQTKKSLLYLRCIFICSHAIHWIQEIKKDVYFKYVRQDRKIKFDLFHTRYLLTDVLLKSLELLTYDFDILKECVFLSLWSFATVTMVRLCSSVS